MQAIVRDITERKRAEEALRFQKMLLESQGEASIEGARQLELIVLDP
jgi:hypothetical protein